MKSKRYFASILLFLVPFVALSQKSKIITGVLEFGNGNYEVALSDLNEALSAQAELEDGDLAKAWLYKGKSLVMLFTQAAQANDAKGLEKYASAYVDAVSCFVHCAERDAKGKYTSELQSDVGDAYRILVIFGQNYMSQGNALNALLNGRAAIFANDRILKKSGYLAYDLEGRAHAGLGDTLNAMQSMEKAIQYYTQSPPDSPDFYIGLTYYSLAMLDKYYKHDINAALGRLDAGLALLDKERARHSMTESDNEIFQQMKDEINNFQMDLYLNAPDKFAEAVQKFKNALAKEPSAIPIRLAYASLLEKSDVNQALKEYEEVLSRDPNNHIALFNAGAIYVNRAAQLNEQSVLTEDYEEAKRLMEAMKAEMKMAYPLFKKAYEIQPESGALGALKQITATLDMTEEYQYYKSLDK